MPTIRELREKRANVWAQAQEFNTRHTAGEEMSAEDHAAWTRALNEIDELAGQVANLERTEQLDKRFASIDAATVTVDGVGDEARSDSEYRKAFDKYLRTGVPSLDNEERQLLQANFRAQAVGTGSAGGYTVPQGFWAKVTETMKYFGGVLQAGSEVINTDSGQTLPWPTCDDTGNSGAILSENSQISAQDLTFGQKQLSAYTYTSKLILVSLQLLQDAGVDAESLVAKKIGERLGRIYNTHGTTGTGSSQPQGVITGATTGKTTAGATAITYGEIVDLVHSVDVAYRQGPGGAKFMFHDLILAYVQKMVDGQSRPLWQPSIAVNTPDTLLGYPIVVNNDMASTVATTNKTMAFGNFNAGYVWRQVAGGQLMRLEERYADYLQVGFFGFGRADGLVQDSGAVKLLVQA